MADTTDDLDLTVLLPAFNEKEAIEPTIREINEVLSGREWSYEILVIDDGSTDETPRLAADLGARVITRRRRMGSGAARRTGLIHARGRIVCMMDADGSYDPATIPEMMGHFPDYDQVNGARDREMGTVAWLRAPVKWALRKFASYLAGERIPDLNTGLKAFKRDLMRRYLWVMPDGFSCVTTMTLAFLCNDHAVKYVPTTYRARIGKSKFHPIRDTARYFLTIVRIIMYFKPLSVFLPVTLLLFATAVGKTVYDLVWALGPDGVTPLHRMEFSDLLLFCAAGFTLVAGLLADLHVSTQRQRLYDEALNDLRDQA